MNTTTKRPTAAAYRFGDADLQLIADLAEHLTATTGVPHSKTDAVRAAVHQLAKREGLTLAKKNQKK